MRILLPALAALALLSGCSPPLSGTYQDVDDPARFYTFSKWTRSWTSYYDESGDYAVQGDRITLHVSGGLNGRLVSADEFQLEDLPSWRADKKFSVFRRKPG
jgi:hypothetical protein